MPESLYRRFGPARSTLRRVVLVILVILPLVILPLDAIEFVG